MKAYRDLGIQRKMQVMTLLICGAVLLVAVAALFSFQVLNFRSNFQRDGLALALIMADNSASAMALKDREAANEAVGTFEAEPNVVSASLVLPNRTLLARYGKPEDRASLANFPNYRAAEFAGGDLLVTQPVTLKREWAGTLYLRMNYQGTFQELVQFYAQVIIVIAIIATALGLFLSSRLGRTITGPVLQLAKTTQVIGEKKDYSVRAIVGDRGDELGRLTESFNEMLARIQSQDAALNLSQQKMEALINSVDGIVWERTPVTFQFTFISRQSESLLGYVPSAWVDQPDFWASKLHPQDAAKAIQTGRDLAVKGRPYSFEYRMQAADDRTVWIRESGMMVKEKGRPVAVRGILQDITRQKRDAEELDKLNRQLIDTSRQAGMADVATGVLHNVGNVLNSVSVSATLVRERLRRSKISNLHRATSMLRDKNGRLAEYLTNDPKGRLLPEYFGTVAEQLNTEQTELVAEVDSMGQNIEHIKEIVAMQQDYARVSGAYENLCVQELVEDAVRMNLASFDRHHIQIVRDFAEDLPKVCVDRHKFLQILINLLRNSKHALEDGEQHERLITVHASLALENQVKIVVRDNGIGIPPENLTKIFSHGFTTKKDGHGFGLHSGALAAKEMGGSLTGRSDGPGLGAEFTLSLPTARTDHPLPAPQTQGTE